MRDNEGSRFFYIKGLSEWKKFILLGYRVIISEDALEVSIFDAVGEI